MSLKKLAAIALAMTMSLSMLAACGDDDSSSSSAPAADNTSSVADESSEEESSEEPSSEDASSEDASSEDDSSEVEMDTEPVAAEGDIQAFLMIADGGWSWGEGNWNLVTEGGLGTDASITGDGTYTVSVNSTQLGAETKGFGYMVFCVDIPGLASTLGCATGGAAVEGTAGAEAEDTAAKVQAAKDAGLSITGVSILQNGEKVFTYNDDDVIFADIEGNGAIRIELWNEYGDTKGAGLAPADVAELAGGVDEYDIIAVEFTIDLPDDLA